MVSIETLNTTVKRHDTKKAMTMTTMRIKIPPERPSVYPNLPMRIQHTKAVMQVIMILPKVMKKARFIISL